MELPIKKSVCMIFEEFLLDIICDKNAKFYSKIAKYWISELQFCFRKAEDSSFIKLVLKFENISIIFRQIRLYQRHHGVQALLTSISAFQRKWYFLLNRYSIWRQILQCYVHVSKAVHA